MGITTESFGKTSKGEEVTKYTITNSNNMSVSFIDLGAVITELFVPDKDGKLEDVVLGFDNAEKYEVNVPSFGAPIGRYANRISETKFTINGKTYQLDNNNAGNTLHSGYNRFNLNFYTASTGKSELGEYVIFYRVSTEEDQGFPGNLRYSITYTLTDDNTLIIRYDALSDADTPLNLTNHSYFNIGPGGEAGGNVLDLVVKIDSDYYTPVDQNILPTGEKLPVKGTIFDFNKAKAIRTDLADSPRNGLIGYDHNYVLKNNGELKEVASLYCPENNRMMTISTDLPGLQLYTAPMLYEKGGKDGRDYGSSAGVCFESQYFPNAINCPEFESPILKANEEYVSYTAFAFSW